MPAVACAYARCTGVRGTPACQQRDNVIDREPLRVQSYVKQCGREMAALQVSPQCRRTLGRPRLAGTR